MGHISLFAQPKGLLIEERMIYDGELTYLYRFEYE